MHHRARLRHRVAASMTLAALVAVVCLAAGDGFPAANPDFNGDGSLDCDDIDALTAEIVAGTNVAKFDVTGDGLVNAADRDEWLIVAGAKNIGPGRAYLPGDANLDGTVDGIDFLDWNQNRFTSTPAWCSGDFNSDGVIDVSDFNIWNAFKFMSS